MQKKQDGIATVLSLDITGSTKLISKLEIEQAREQIERGLKLMSNAVTCFEGEILRFEGDEIIAIFQATAENEKHSLLALMATQKAINLIQDKDLTYEIRAGLAIVPTYKELDNSLEYYIDIAKNLQKHAKNVLAVLPEEMIDLVSSKVKQGATGNIKLAGETINYQAIESINKNDYEEMHQLFSAKSDVFDNFTTDIDQEIGEKKLVTISFIAIEDTKNQLSQKQKVKLIPHIKGVIEEYGGTLIKGFKLTAMVITGAPKAYEDHALRACLIVNKLKEIIAKVNKNLAFRAGIHSGLVVVDEIGDKSFKRYDAIGLAVNIAARIFQSTRPGEQAISAKTKSLLGDAVLTGKAQKKNFKGINESVIIFNIVNVRDEVINKKLELDFYGRQVFINHEQELSTFEEILEQVNNNKFKLLGLEGEPGIGKSRLSYELKKRAEDKAFLVVSVSAMAYQKEVSFSLLRKLLYYFFDIKPLMGTQEKLQRIKASISKYNLTSDNAEHALLTIVGSVVDNKAWTELTIPMQIEHIVNTLFEIIKHISKKPALLIILEDMHWCDSQSLQVLLMLSEKFNQDKIFFLFNFRPEFHESIKSFNAKVLQLSPLSQRDCTKFVDCLLGDNKSIQPIKKLIIKQSMGNPFYIEELLRYFINKNVIKKEFGSYNLSKNIKKETMPDSIRGVISGSIDTLNTTEKMLLQEASILGRVFPLTYLKMISELGDESLQANIDSLVEMQLIYLSQFSPEPIYSFKHAYILDVCYNTMLNKRRIALHRKFFKKLKEKQKDDEFLPALANHAMLGELWEEALLLYEKMLPRDINIDFPIDRIISEVKNASAAYSHLCESLKVKYFDQYATLKILSLHSMFASGRGMETIDDFKQLIKDSSERKRYLTVFNALTHLILINLLTHLSFDIDYDLDEDFSILTEAADKAVKEDSTIDTANLYATAYFINIISAYMLGNLDKLEHYAKKIRDLISVPNTVSQWLGIPLWVVSRLLTTHMLVEKGRIYDEKIEEFKQEYLKAVDNTQPSESTINNYWALTLIAFNQGDFIRAKQYAETGIEQSHQSHVVIFLPAFFAILAQISMLTEDKVTAKKYAEQFVELTDKMHHIFFSMIFVARVIEVLIYIGDIDTAKRLTETCLAIIDRKNYREKARYVELLLMKALIMIEEFEPSQLKKIETQLKALLDYTEIQGYDYYLPLIHRPFIKLYLLVDDQQKIEFHQARLEKTILSPMKKWHNYFWYENIT